VRELRRCEKEGGRADVKRRGFRGRGVGRRLLQAGTDVDGALDDGRTALMTAAQMGHEAVASMLLKAGAKVRKKQLDGCTALSIAAERGHVTLMAVLLLAGADADEAFPQWAHINVPGGVGGPLESGGGSHKGGCRCITQQWGPFHSTVHGRRNWPRDGDI